ncbi:unnamed protein product [[Candida] boidinii]|uniref:Mannan endo-1,6-alpha-mannosidase n=1 Tax=Candida boidinii TaxID=5477 RepID=A0A9W6SXS3_CANBO|nr:hypothetical protein B5S30_g2822 [[Candida] boidinii]OWB84096.1 hypothetical protein B5S33_g2733 [[Candida] boidinii]GME69298.1 unnamed protein product [[Candida] boidinii]
MKFSNIIASCLLTISSYLTLTSSLELDPNDRESIANATALISTGLMDYYWGTQSGGTIGMFTNPYYWWEAGGAWGSMLGYWYLLENDTYNDIIMQALLYQVGEDWDYIPLNQSTTEGNDDQVFWGIAVMDAAERNFTNPSEKEPQWLYLAQAVFNTMAWRWDDSSCGGGLRWQIFKWNSGYDYKNTVSNAGLFHLGARLYRYTENQTYYDWCERTYNWLLDVDFIEEKFYYIYDGANVENNCTNITRLQWSYNAGLLISGCAYLYNATEDQVWLDRTEGYVNGLEKVFFNNSIMFEVACQGVDNCNNDQRSFKAYLSRFIGLTSILAPTTYDSLRTYLEASAVAAAKSCSGGYDGHTCGMNWFVDGWDGKYGLGEQMSALEVMQNLLISERPGPLTAKTGGTSVGNGSAGHSLTTDSSAPLSLDKGDSAGAAIITAVVGISIICCGIWLVI